MNIASFIPRRQLFARKPAFLVGGSIRDILLGRPPEDFDIVPLESPRTFALALQSETGGALVELGTPRQRLYRIVTPEHIFDITPMNGPDIGADLGKRDFTINALALRLDTEELIDITGGLEDLKTGRIRAVSKDVFRQDPARLIRGYRLSASLNFELTAETISRIHTDTEQIKTVAGERIRAELFKLLATNRAYPFLRSMSDIGLLQTALAHPSRFRIEDARNRLKGIREFESSLEIMEKKAPAAEIFSRDQIPVLKFALVLLAMIFDEAASDTSSVEAIFRRLRLSNRECETIRHVLDRAATTMAFLKSSLETGIDRRKAFHLFSVCGKELPGVLFASLGFLSNRSPIFSRTALTRAAFDIHHLYEDEFLSLAETSPVIDGHHLMDRLNLPPGPLVGRILNRINEEKFSRCDLTRDEAMALARRFLNSDSKT